MDYNKLSWVVMDLYSKLITENKDYITKEMIEEVKGDYLSTLDAYHIIIASLFELDINKDREIFELYIKNVIKELDVSNYISNPYYTKFKFDELKYKNWRLGYETYKSYELFVCDDMKSFGDVITPSLGYFTTSYRYPAIYLNDRLWMSICPNEINTMAKDINDAFGNVLVIGLGLGYYPYMISLNKNVKSITIVEIDKELISFFTKCIYKDFDTKIKIQIINEDGFKYVNNINKSMYDYVFIDIWHDPSDGVELYNKFKKLEQKDIVYRYWIEKTMKYYV